MESAFKKTSELTEDERAFIARFLHDAPWFLFYYECALVALEDGLDNRSFLLGEGRTGLILSIHFDGINIFSTVGELAPKELSAILEWPERAEIHIEAAHQGPLESSAGDRVRRIEAIRFYSLENQPHPCADTRCRRLVAADHVDVNAFFQAHYPETVITDYMFTFPMVGVWEEGELLAVAGTLTFNSRLKTANIGNFLTHPVHRGKGLAKVAAHCLFNVLHDEGIETVQLGVFDSNEPAWRAYETLGFQLLESRPMIYLDSTA